MEAKPCCGSNGHRHKKGCEQDKTQSISTPLETNQSMPEPTQQNDELLARLAELERQRQEDRKTIEMLYAVADKGRVFNYENKNQGNKSFKIKLSVWNEKIIVGWRTVKDELIIDPRTGATVGETQQYEVLLLDKNNVTTAETINGYLNFSNIRYDKRIECEVVGKREDFEGNITFDLSLPDGRPLSINSRFAN